MALPTWDTQRLPIAKPILAPNEIVGFLNGAIPTTAMTAIFGSTDPRCMMNSKAARALEAFCAAFKAGTGLSLTWTSRGDVYRSYQSQVNGFVSRYQTCSPVLYALTPTSRRKKWEDEPRKPPTYLRQVYWRKIQRADGTYPATIATPGTSNHGWSLAIDTALGAPGINGTSHTTKSVDWMRANVQRFGWSYESQSENWHIRYVMGEHLPLDVFIYEARAERPLNKGMLNDPDVTRMQKVVGAAADGDYGPKTAAKVAEWKAPHNLGADGNTWTPREWGHHHHDVNEYLIGQS